MVATTMAHPKIMKAHKNLPGDTPNDFSKFRGDWMCGFLIHFNPNKETLIHFYLYRFTFHRVKIHLWYTSFTYLHFVREYYIIS